MLWPSHPRLLRRLSAKLQTLESWSGQRNLLEARVTISNGLQSAEYISNPSSNRNDAHFLHQWFCRSRRYHSNLCHVPNLVERICNNILLRLCFITDKEYVQIPQARVQKSLQENASVILWHRSKLDIIALELIENFLHSSMYKAFCRMESTTFKFWLSRQGW